MQKESLKVLYIYNFVYSQDSETEVDRTFHFGSLRLDKSFSRVRGIVCALRLFFRMEQQINGSGVEISA